MTNKDHIKTAVSYLSKSLEDNQPKVRAKAAEALGQIDIDILGKIGLDKTILSLIKALSDVKDNVRLSAINAIGKICSRH